jgi:ABC-type lipoprotein export system ATPase subunit
MRGPLPSYRPAFPSTFLEQAEEIAQQRTVQYQLRQRATLVLLLQQHPLVSNVEAAERVQLPLRSVQRWRRRWATGDFSLEDEPGRGRKATFSPLGPCLGQGSRL